MPTIFETPKDLAAAVGRHVGRLRRPSRIGRRAAPRDGPKLIDLQSKGMDDPGIGRIFFVDERQPFERESGERWIAPIMAWLEPADEVIGLGDLEGVGPPAPVVV